MSKAAHNPAKSKRTARITLALLLLFAPACGRISAQSNGSDTAVPDANAVQLDRVVAIVNDDLILESDVDEERRLAVFQPYSQPTGSFTRADAIQRLINRALILQQSRIQPRKPITDAEVAANLKDLRKDILECRTQYKCETDAGWHDFLAANGFTEAELTLRWRERMETLQFIEDRFRMGIRISDADVKTYYTKTLLSEYAARHATAPKLDTISDRIREILLQQQVGGLLDDWLKALRASGNVRMVPTSEAAS